MYGMINQAIEKLVCDEHGAATWNTICREARIEDRDFVSLQHYPDEVTFRLVGAASTVLGVPAEKVLEVFGESWTDYAKETAFAGLMKFAGRTFPEFVASLDQMHAKIKFSLPDLQPPSFRVTDMRDDSFRLHYYSSRQGLAPLVVGMMKGVGKIYDVSVDMHLESSRADGHDHDEFIVRYVPSVPKESNG